MNYLAHLYLASNKGNARIGGLLGDFVKGTSKEDYSNDIQTEIRLHQLIDIYTDNDLIVINARKIVDERKRRYMGILLDVFYDHILASKWNTYSEIELKDFAQQMYQLLEVNKAILPQNLTKIMPTMIQEDWLTSYKDFDGFNNAISRVSKKINRGNLLLECAQDIESHYDLLSTSFDDFFPKLIKYVQEQRRILSI